MTQKYLTFKIRQDSFKNQPFNDGFQKKIEVLFIWRWRWKSFPFSLIDVFLFFEVYLDARGVMQKKKMKIHKTCQPLSGHLLPPENVMFWDIGAWQEDNFLINFWQKIENYSRQLLLFFGTQEKKYSKMCVKLLKLKIREDVWLCMFLIFAYEDNMTLELSWPNNFMRFVFCFVFVTIKLSLVSNLKL